MADLTKKTNPQETFLNKIPGIHATKIYSVNNVITEIHVITDMDHHPKQLSRDIQSALAAEFDFRVDHKVISIAQIDIERPLDVSWRLCIHDIDVTTISRSATVRVVLRKRDKLYEGVAQGPNSKMNIYRLLAIATISCVSQFVDCGDVFTVEDICWTNLVRNSVINIAVSYIASYNEELLVGSCLFKDNSEQESVVKATLDALNRKILLLVD